MSPLKLSDMIAKLGNNLLLRAKPSKESLVEIQEALVEYLDLVVKVNELKRYLELPKFQGDERVGRTCSRCDHTDYALERKDWVAVGDIFDRL